VEESYSLLAVVMQFARKPVRRKICPSLFSRGRLGGGAFTFMEAEERG